MPDLHDNEDELAARAQFIDGRERSRELRLVNEWQDRLWLEGKLLERDRDEIRHRSDGRPDGGLVGLLLTRRIARVAADLEFLASLRGVLETSVSPANASAPSVSDAGHRDGDDASTGDKVRVRADRH